MTDTSFANSPVAGHSYVVVGTKPWNRRIYDEMIAPLPGDWHYIDRRSRLTADQLADLEPRYIFFLHWSNKVTNDVFESYECVVFHMTDVPYGRGGSPLQNLIVRGHESTKLSALKMTEQLDAGPVYCKETLSLDGSAEEVYVRATRLSARMIERILREDIQPSPQEGDVVEFKRRKPRESEIPALEDLASLHDFIRMLDAEGYPHAYLDHEGFRYRFRRSVLYDGRIHADVHIEPISETE